MTSTFDYLKKIGTEEEKRFNLPHISNVDLNNDIHQMVNMLKTDSIQELKRENYNRFERQLSDRFNKFSKKYPSLFFKLIKENDLNQLDSHYRRIMDMLYVRQQILNNDITQQEGYFKVKQDLDDEFIVPIAEKLNAARLSEQNGEQSNDNNSSN